MAHFLFAARLRRLVGQPVGVEVKDGNLGGMLTAVGVWGLELRDVRDLDVTVPWSQVERVEHGPGMEARVGRARTRARETMDKLERNGPADRPGGLPEHEVNELLRRFNGDESGN